LCNICSAFETALEKTKLDGHDTQDIDIFIEQKLSYVHAKVDLKPTISGLLTLEKCIYRLDKGTVDNLSLVLARGLQKRLDRMETKLVRVSGKKYLKDKRKRSIEFVGDLISDLFGNPGPADWKKNTANVLALQKALKRLNDNSAIDHTDIDTNRHNIEQNNNEIRSLISTVSKTQAALATVSDELTSLKSYFEVSHLADAIENQIDYLVEVKSDSVKGFCSDRALDKDFLTDNLRMLEANKIGLSPIFSNWEWREYYKFDMCSIAMDGEALWVTLRIPLVKKSEKLVRVIPFPNLREVLFKVESYGIEVVLFKEKDNDKFHVMTSSALDFCTNLGKKRSCSVRDVRFSISSPFVIPVEFALNRFLMVSNEMQTVKLMGRCPNGMTEHVVETDAVLLVPVNCSYIGKSVTIDTRESDTAITKEIGIVHFENLEISRVNNLHLNLSQAEVTSISNRTLNSNFALNKKFIDEQLEQIDTKHDNLLTRYTLEKWILIVSLLTVTVVVVSFKIFRCMYKRKITSQIDIELGRPRNTTTHTTQTKQHIQQQQQQLQQQLHKQPQTTQTSETNAENVYTEVSETDELTFSSPPELSQFYEPGSKK